MNDLEDHLLNNAAATTEAGKFYLYHIKRYDIDPHCDDVSDRDLYDAVAVLETSSDISSKLVVLCQVEDVNIQFLLFFFTTLLFISRFSYWYKRCCCIDRSLLYKLRGTVCDTDLCILPSAAQVSCLPQTTGRLLFRLLSHMSCVCTEEGETKSPSGRR